MLNVTLDESECFASWMCTEDVPNLDIEDPKKGQIFVTSFIFVFSVLNLENCSCTRLTIATTFWLW